MNSHRSAYVRHRLALFVDRNAPWHVYTLHLETRLLGVLHYTGRTRTHRIDHRLRQHATGHGAQLTRQAVRDGRHLFLVDLKPSYRRSDETEMSPEPLAAARCALCTPRLRHPAAAHMLPRQITAQEPRSWPGSRFLRFLRSL